MEVTLGLAASEAAEEVLFRTLKVEPVLPWSLCLAPMLDWLFMRLVTTSNSYRKKVQNRSYAVDYVESN